MSEFHPSLIPQVCWRWRQSRQALVWDASVRENRNWRQLKRGCEEKERDGGGSVEDKNDQETAMNIKTHVKFVRHPKKHKIENGFQQIQLLMRTLCTRLCAAGCVPPIITLLLFWPCSLGHVNHFQTCLIMLFLLMCNKVENNEVCFDEAFQHSSF